MERPAVVRRIPSARHASRQGTVDDGVGGDHLVNHPRHAHGRLVAASGYPRSPDTAGQAVEVVASDHRYHPVLDYLDRCRWDGTHRLDEWPIKFLGTPDTPYARAVGSRWIISAVARITEPGCKADHALILQGRQGILKSTALKTLAQPWFADEIADLGTKDAAMQTAGVWVLEIAELDAMSRGDIAKIKSFTSRTTDRFRPPYGRRIIEAPRQCVFAGTVNHSDYLRDETGGRRFWPIDCTTINVDGLSQARDQLWAEARDRYLASEVWWLDDPSLNNAAAEEQDARFAADVWHERVAGYVNGLPDVSVPEILRVALEIPIERWTQSEQTRIARCLKHLGWERYRKRNGAILEWRYRPVPSVVPSEVM
jgi:predicted P-loop ATPase